jgi:hypothetical protein
MAASVRLQALAERWADAAPAERANLHLYVTEFCDALGVARPRPAGSGYEFEFPVRVVSAKGQEATKFIDLYKAGHFVLEAKDQGRDDPEGRLLQEAFGHARVKAGQVSGGPPPYLLVLDVGNTIRVWDRWNGSFGGFSSARRIPLRTLHERPDDIELLRDIWENPEARNPQIKAAAVTRHIAEKLAALASSLEKRGHHPETAASFLIRCVFTMFAEDIELIPDHPFQRALEDIGLTDPEEFRETIEALWAAMDKGERFGLRKLLHFDGHFFRDARALPLTREDIAILLEAAEADWSEVEPSIMGTLLVRALDPAERHRLGAQFTPSEYVQRLVRPTVEEPIRERWTQVQAEVLQLLDANRKSPRKQKADRQTALSRLRDFHDWLRGLRFLDPACGSGNFLYVTLRLVKQVEAEVLRSIEEVEGHPDVQLEEVGPWQFHGMEIKPWAREIAELTLWIGHFQIWRELHSRTQPPEPVLRDTGTLECRDAVLAWDEIWDDPARSRPDPTPRIPHPVTGELVPDPGRTLPYLVYSGARPTEWPDADFIIGNPPYMGISRQREAFGDGYVEALRAAYNAVPDTADYVMYWWHVAAARVASGGCMRAGLITTNTITQGQNRAVVARAATQGAGVVWAIADHPWIDEAGAADVRVAMTVIAREPDRAVLVIVDDDGNVTRQMQAPVLNPDLTMGTDVAKASSRKLASNRGLASRGFQLIGPGFIVEAGEAERLLSEDPRRAEVLKKYRHGRDIAQRPRGLYVIDFGLMEEDEARDFPVLFDLVRTRVKPHRDANRDRSTREKWWRFGRNREEFRPALNGLSRLIATPETARHRYFVFLDGDVAPDNMLVCMASDDAFHLGVLSSRIHVEWSLAAGGRLGVGNDPRYNKTRCFDSFPFPDTLPQVRDPIASIAEALDSRRWKALACSEKVTLTRIYNVLEKLRAGEPLTPAEREIHDLAACGVLLDLHNELDALVAEAYGSPWPMERDEILQRLVDLHDERVEEERAGKVRWLRPVYQIPRFRKDVEGPPGELDLGEEPLPTPAVPAAPWPSTTIEQIAALQDLLKRSPSTLAEAASAFKGSRRDQVERHLETLVMMGEAWIDPEGVYHLLTGEAA